MSGRDWKRINEALVRRGGLLLDLDFVKGWESELEAMNRGKEGARFRYPDSLATGIDGWLNQPSHR